MSSLYKVTHDERETLGKFVDSRINLMNTIVLAKIDSIEQEGKFVTVTPLSKRVWIDDNNEEQLFDFPQIQVRLLYQKGFISQLEEGDTGLLLVAQSDIDYYIDNSSDYVNRRFDLVDALYIPLAISEQETTEVEIKSTDYIKIANSQFDLLALLKSLANYCSQIHVNESGALDPGLVADFQLIEQEINTFIKT